MIFTALAPRLIQSISRNVRNRKNVLKRLCGHLCAVFGLSSEADDEGTHKKLFFFFLQNYQVFAKVTFTQQKNNFYSFFFKTKCKNAPGVAGAVLQTVSD